MERCSTILDIRGFVRQQKQAGKTITFVPTMGALHAGHRSCMDIARKAGDCLVVSIFVNPTQFGPNEDIDSYPHALDEDLARCHEWGCDAVFSPSVSEMYPESHTVWVEPGPAAEPLCGRTRKGHFRGVTTVVRKLFDVVEPDIAVFGQKDAQQATVIREMVRQLNLPVRLLVSPIIREEDGLALSSRNRRLTRDERPRAVALHHALGYGLKILSGGEINPRKICEAVIKRLNDDGVDRVEYVELLRVPELSGIERVEGKLLLAAAVHVGSVRLIDNRVVQVAADGQVSEAPLFDVD